MESGEYTRKDASILENQIANIEKHYKIPTPPPKQDIQSQAISGEIQILDIILPQYAKTDTHSQNVIYTKLKHQQSKSLKKSSSIKRESTIAGLYSETKGNLSQAIKEHPTFVSASAIKSIKVDYDKMPSKEFIRERKESILDKRKEKLKMSGKKKIETPCAPMSRLENAQAIMHQFNKGEIKKLPVWVDKIIKESRTPKTIKADPYDEKMQYDCDDYEEGLKEEMARVSLNSDDDIECNVFYTESGKVDVSLDVFDVIDKILCLPNIMPENSLFYAQTINFIYQIYRSRNLTDYVSASFQYGTSLGIDPSTLRDIVREFGKSHSLWPVRMESYADNIGDVSRFLSQVMGSKLLQSIRGFIMCIVSLKFLNKDISKKFTDMFGKLDDMPLADFIPRLLDHVAKIAKFIEAMLGGMPFSEYLVAEDPLVAAETEIMDTLIYQKSLYSGLPVPGYMCQKLFVSKLDNAEGFLSKALLTLPRYSVQYRNLSTTIAKARVAANAVRTQIASSTRSAPIGIMLHSTPGCGKSKILPFICQIYARVKGKKFDMSCVFHRIVTSQFFSGVEPWSKYIWHYSELGNKARSLVAKQGDDVLNEVCSVIDNLPFPLDMADVDEKGKFFAMPEVVICDTNNPDLNADVLVSNKAALDRRFLFIGVTVKPEFRKDGAMSIDPEKSLKAGGNLMDRYLFRVYTKEVQSNNTSTPIIHLDNADIDTLEMFLVDHFTQHIQLSDKIARSIDDNGIRAEALNYAENESLYYYLNESVLPGYFKSIFYFPIWLVGVIAPPSLNWIYNFFFPLLAIIFYLTILCGIWGTTSLMSGFLLRQVTNSMTLLLWQYLNVQVLMIKQWFGILPPKFQDKRIQNFLVVTAWFAGFYALHRWYTKEIATSESQTSFLDPSDKNGFLNNVEEQSKSDDTLIRYPIANSSSWNTRTVLNINSVCKNLPGDVCGTIAHNIRKVKIHGQIMTTTHILGIASDVAVVNTHALTFNEQGVCKITVVSDYSSITNATYITTKDIHHVSTDISLIRVSHVLFRDIRDYIANDYINVLSTPAYLNSKHLRATLITNPVTLVDSGGDITISNTYSYDYSDHKSGDCGLPLIVAIGGGYCLAGIHCAGSDKGPKSFAATFLSKEIEQAMELERSSRSILPLISVGDVITEVLVDPSPQSPVNFIPLHALTYYGKRPHNVMINNKSQVRFTPFAMDAENIFKHSLRCDGEWLYGKPPLKPFYANGEYISPYNIALSKMNKNGVALNPLILDKVVNILVTRFSSVKSTISPLTFDLAVNGSLNDYLTRRINPSTAAGSLFPGKKNHYIPVVDETDTKVTREPIHLLKERLHTIIKCYESQKTGGILYSSNLKDEARATTKNVLGKTRVFYGSPIDFLILCKMYLSPFYTLMMEHPDIFCTAIGIDMHMGADELAQDMNNFAKKFFEGDYGSYDLTMPYEIGLAACTIVYRVLEQMGYTPYALNIVSALLTENMFPVIDVMKDIFMVPGMQPSGKYGTAEDNCLRGVVMILYYWHHTKYSHLCFFDFVKLVTYGDDVVAAVKDEVIDEFNNISYAKFAYQHYNMTFTPAIKDSEMQAYLDISSISFLKRNFRFSQKLNRWVAPLSIDSVVKIMTFTIPSKSVTEETQMIDCVSSSMLEYFFHTVDEGSIWEEARSEWIDILHRQYGVPVDEIHSYLPMWSTLLTKFTKITALKA